MHDVFCFFFFSEIELLYEIYYDDENFDAFKAADTRELMRDRHQREALISSS